MTSCVASSVRDQGRVLRGAVGSAIVVSLCLRAGDGPQTSCGCPMPVAARFVACAVGVVGCGWGSLNVGFPGWCRASLLGLRWAFACPWGRQALPIHQPYASGGLGVAFRRCEGRVVSGTVSPPASHLWAV